MRYRRSRRPLRFVMTAVHHTPMQRPILPKRQLRRIGRYRVRVSRPRHHLPNRATFGPRRTRTARTPAARERRSEVRVHPRVPLYPHPSGASRDSHGRRLREHRSHRPTPRTRPPDRREPEPFPRAAVPNVAAPRETLASTRVMTAPRGPSRRRVLPKWTEANDCLHPHGPRDCSVPRGSSHVAPGARLNRSRRQSHRR